MNKLQYNKMTVEEAETILWIFKIQCTPEEAKAFLIGNIINERVMDATWASMKLMDNEWPGTEDE